MERDEQVTLSELNRKIQAVSGVCMELISSDNPFDNAKGEAVMHELNRLVMGWLDGKSPLSHEELGQKLASLQEGLN